MPGGRRWYKPVAWAVLLGCVSVVIACLLSCPRAQPASGALTLDQLQAAQDRLIESLIRRGYLRTERVIQAMRLVKRHLFVPPDLWPLAYEDHPLPIGYGQTISAPSIVAIMTEMVAPGPDKTMLEIGTGSGYQAAVLGVLCKHVYTIEILEPLATRAARTLKELGYSGNITVRCADGYRGWPEHAPFDGIMVTCAPEKVPQPLVDQLKDGGRMVIPVGREWEQELVLLEKTNGQLTRTATIPVLFVPMTGEAQQVER